MLREIGNHMQNWLSAAIADADFGDSIDQLSLVLVCVDADPEENDRWASPYRKLGWTTDSTGMRARFLSIPVLVPPKTLASATPLVAVSQLAMAAMKPRPNRVAKGFDYDRLSASVIATLDVLASA